MIYYFSQKRIDELPLPAHSFFLSLTKLEIQHRIRPPRPADPAVAEWLTFPSTLLAERKCPNHCFPRHSHLLLSAPYNQASIPSSHAEQLPVPPQISRTMLVRCQCGTVSFPTPTAQPLSLYHCHCLECQNQSASAFGTSAIFPVVAPLFPLAPDLKAKLSVYTRPTETGGAMDCYFCRGLRREAVSLDSRPGWQAAG